MTTDEASNVDLSFLRNLAEAGQDAPLTMGPYLIAGGGWFGLASLVIGLAQIGVIPSGVNAVLWQSMLIAFVGFAVTLFLLIRRERGRVQNTTNNTLGAAWSAVGWGIFLFAAAIFIVAAKTGEGYLLNSISLVVLTLYAVAWKLSAAVSRKTWMNAIVFLTVVSLLIVAASIGSMFSWLAYAAALILSAVLPGFYLVSLARKQQR
jgi:drug/metabolite transporter (DMT)-like permease